VGRWQPLAGQSRGIREARREAGRSRQEAHPRPGRGSLRTIEGDFLCAAIPGRFDLVCCWEVFGIGTDDNQIRLLRRIAEEWLDDGGVAIVEAYSPIGPIKYSGTSRRPGALKGVPGLRIARAEYHGIELDVSEEALAEGCPTSASHMFDCEDDYASVVTLVREDGR